MRTILIIIGMLSPLLSPFAATAPPEPPTETLVVYYFLTDVRCVSCQKIEQFTEATLNREFAAELAAGRVEWRPINTDRPEHAHFVKDYQLYTKSVVLVRETEGRRGEWKNLPRIWQLLNNPTAYTEYVAGEIRGFLGNR